jgi:hypothetical protein
MYKIDVKKWPMAATFKNLTVPDEVLKFAAGSVGPNFPDWVKVYVLNTVAKRMDDLYEELMSKHPLLGIEDDEYVSYIEEWVKDYMVAFLVKLGKDHHCIEYVEDYKPDIDRPDLFNLMGLGDLKPL